METWRDVFVLVIMAAVAFFGSPITQVFKNLLSKIFKKVIEDKWALLLSVVISCGLAVLEMYLNGQLVDFKLTPDNFLLVVGPVFAISQIYYRLLSQSNTTLGAKTLLKPPTVS